MREVSEYLETFRQEADELLATVEAAVLVLEGTPDDRDALDRLFRAMHTVKGSGSMFGLDQVASFTHHIETLLDEARAGRQPVNRQFIDLILAATDHISGMLGEAWGGPEVDRDTGSALVERAKALTTGPTAEAHTRGTEVARLDGEAVYRIRFRPNQNLFATGCDPGLLLNELRGLGECQIVAQTDTLPPFDQMNPELCYLAWDIVLATAHELDAIHDVFIFVDMESEVTIDEISRKSLVDETAPVPRLGEILVERRDVSVGSVQSALSEQREMNSSLGALLMKTGNVAPDRVRSALAEQEALERQRAAVAHDTVRVASTKLDALINVIGELVISQEQLNAMALKSGQEELSTPVEVMNRLVGELRDLILTVRMVPIGRAFSRYRRLVRDIALEQGKEVDLVMVGDETEMDKTVIDQLGDPLLHLIRNSIDHGIELPEERERLGKPRHGTLRLVAEHHGVSVVITIEDDGRGLNTDLIRSKAIARGLLRPDEPISDKAVQELIFEPGFSTASEVTSLSGRGVGMDVVKRTIEALRGTATVRSERSTGTAVALTLPLTLAIIDGLLVDVDGHRYVIPVSLIEQCMEFTSAHLALGSRRNVIRVMGEPIPIVRLRDLFGASTLAPEMQEIVVTRIGDGRIGVVVDHIIGDYQTVVKPLGRLYREAEGISGATIMGDGEVALILDVAGLVSLAQREDEESYILPSTQR